ncbi:MAG: potassium channel family protein [Pseudomonadota bacterium]
MWIYFINILLVSIAVLIHYEALRQLSVNIPKFAIRPRLRVLVGVVGALCAHVLEIWLFGLGYHLMHHHALFGQLVGQFSATLMDSVYFSFATYTSLGLGDISPVGDIRFVAGLEALLGLVLITWSASFMFLEMTRYWTEE